MKVNFTIPGAPVGKARPRFRVIKAHDGRQFPVAYSPKETASYENLVKTAFRQAHCGNPTERPVSIIIKAFFPIPASATKKFKMAAANEDIPVTKKPDYDNIAKIISDALNQIAYRDDSQVFEAIITKAYSLNPRTCVTINDEIKLEF
jgi:Holliday junction resolvase RusA-like endonuclease